MNRARVVVRTFQHVDAIATASSERVEELHRQRDECTFRGHRRVVGEYPASTHACRHSTCRGQDCCGGVVACSQRLCASETRPRTLQQPALTPRTLSFETTATGPRTRRLLGQARVGSRGVRRWSVHERRRRPVCGRPICRTPPCRQTASAQAPTSPHPWLPPPRHRELRYFTAGGCQPPHWHRHTRSRGTEPWL